MTLNLTAATKNARMTALKNTIDAASAAKLLLYTSPRPATGAAATGTLLVSIALTQPCGVVDASGLHLVAAGSAQASGTGIATWARLVDGNNNAVFDCDAKQTDDPRQAELILDIAAMYPGAFVNLVSAVITEA